MGLGLLIEVSTFFQENEKALTCEIDAADNIIYSASIKKWEGPQEMSDLENERVLKLIETYYKIYIDDDVKNSLTLIFHLLISGQNPNDFFN